METGEKGEIPGEKVFKHSGALGKRRSLSGGR